MFNLRPCVCVEEDHEKDMEYPVTQFEVSGKSSSKSMSICNVIRLMI